MSKRLKVHKTAMKSRVSEIADFFEPIMLKIIAVQDCLMRGIILTADICFSVKSPAGAPRIP